MGLSLILRCLKIEHQFEFVSYLLPCTPMWILFPTNVCISIYIYIDIAFITRISIRSILGSWMLVKYKRASFQARKRIMEVRFSMKL
jgi:hypothetical protein